MAVVSGEDFSNIEKMLTTNELTAPIEKGEQIGTVTYRLNGKELGSIGIYAGESVREAKFSIICLILCCSGWQLFK